VTPFGLKPQQQRWEVFSQDHSNKKKVMFDIFFGKKQREHMPNLKLNKRCAALTLAANIYTRRTQIRDNILWITTADLYKLRTTLN